MCDDCDDCDNYKQRATRLFIRDLHECRRRTKFYSENDNIMCHITEFQFLIVTQKSCGSIKIGYRISLGIFFNYYCSRKRGHIHPSASNKTRELGAIPKGESTSTSKQLKIPQYGNSSKHEPIVIKQHGPAIDITESDDLPDSLFYPTTQTIYESKQASNSMINLAPSQQPNLSSAESQEMIRSHSG
ncbi:hypothetical protein GLOIN_2v1844903 [Rhizophagus irregularis DAOM 181602=DAOM 197198]|uniref:Uncharacterized protein n=1 Tax=Rhizophagus irregularis (strain DAOM 181602 / DAOM 197198 / MUCL 43194) TaxID=747089 RepID=A0A2P4PIF1_RHIID|nr:hypothetical protein GLOIN_2v1844903 [Rhizophagus irregularis DAOM 181602=DAOM 197198]POG65172.1 hypothetical protein GLOIN_2v1844903 [Rhizophagus irregularis DAOM 181602=DAOM 197198]|eukprot:XP_025172038.1 hypothetical protein GLOIN_2v1844903 [Rhizophagus irregularis DAOM 181602=DAOM 197198]